MNSEKMGGKPSPRAPEDMLDDLGVSGVQADQIRALLGEVAGLAHEVPKPSELTMRMPPWCRSRMLVLSAAGFMTTRASRSSPGV